MQAASRDLQSAMGFIEGDDEGEIRCAGGDEIKFTAASSGGGGQWDLVSRRGGDLDEEKISMTTWTL